MQAGTSDKVPRTFLGSFVNILSGSLSLIIICLVIVSIRSFTNFFAYEKDLVEKLQPLDIKREANLVIKNFMLLRYLRRHDKELTLRAKISMQFILAKERFNSLRKPK